MKIFTTEAQRHRENEEGKDHRTSGIIGAAIEVHRRVDSLNEGAAASIVLYEAAGRTS
jgi:hypothetical protein